MGINYDNLSEADLVALQAGNYDGVSEEGLMRIQESSQPQDAFVDTRSAAVPFKERAIAKNLAVGPDQQAAYYAKQLGVETRVKDDNVYARPRGSKEAFSAVDPSSLDLEDLSDIAYDVVGGAGQGAATIAGGVGGLPGMAAAGAASGAGVEGLRQLLGNIAGIEDNFSAGQIGFSGAMGAASPVVSEKIAKPLLNKLGSALYKSAPGIRQADDVAAEYSKTAPSDVLTKYNIKGTSKNISKKANEKIHSLTKERDAILKEASDSGVAVDSEAAAGKGMQLLSDLDDPKVYGRREIVDELLPELEKFMTSTNKSSPSQMTKSASMLYKKASNGAFKDFGTTEEGERFFRQMGLGARDATKEAVSSWDANAGKKLSSLNDEISSLITARKVLEKESHKAGPSLFSSVDGMIVGVGNPALLAAKKVADASKTTWARTQGGSALKSLGNQSLWPTMVGLNQVDDQLNKKEDKK